MDSRQSPEAFTFCGSSERQESRDSPPPALVQGRGNFDVFKELFADDFTDHTPQPGTTPDKAGVRKLYTYLRTAFPDFHAEIHWQLAAGDRVTTYKTYYGTHQGPDVMRVQNGKITDHWGVANLLSLMQQIGGWNSP